MRKGEMAYYGRPFQHVAFYELDEEVVELSVPRKRGKPKHFFIENARRLGCEVEVILGDARHTLSNDVTSAKARTQKRDKYYQLIVLDVCSDAAIPVHMLTLEAFELYMSKLNARGLLCVRTTNEYVDLTRVVCDVGRGLKLNIRVGKDKFLNRGIEEFVVLARDENKLPAVTQGPAIVEWTAGAPARNKGWTDDKADVLEYFRGKKKGQP
jgi:hypothetical protein